MLHTCLLAFVRFALVGGQGLSSRRVAEHHQQDGAVSCIGPFLVPSRKFTLPGALSCRESQRCCSACVRWPCALRGGAERRLCLARSTAFVVTFDPPHLPCS